MLCSVLYVPAAIVINISHHTSIFNRQVTVCCIPYIMLKMNVQLHGAHGLTGGGAISQSTARGGGEESMAATGHQRGGISPSRSRGKGRFQQGSRASNGLHALHEATNSTHNMVYWSDAKGNLKHTCNTRPSKQSLCPGHGCLKEGVREKRPRQSICREGVTGATEEAERRGMMKGVRIRKSGF